MTNPGLLFRGVDPTSAVAVRDGRILATGHDALTYQPSEIVDTGSGELIPAFRDGHVHPVWGGLSLRGLHLDDATTVDEITDRVARFSAEQAGTGWIIGSGYDPSLLPDGLGLAAVLDRVESGRPVLLWASDHHSAWVNSAALQRAGITTSTPDPQRGRICRDEKGAPTGALLEEPARTVAALAPPPTRDNLEGALRTAMARFAASGLTFVQDASCLPGDLDVYRAVADAAGLPCRANIALRVDPDRWREQVEEFVATRHEAESVRDVSATTVKFFADGIIESGTGALLDPYTDDHTSCGIANWAAAELDAAIAAFDARGFQVHIHAIGDAAVRQALDAIEALGAVGQPRDRRPVIAHTQLVHPDDIVRFAALGVIANFEPLWAQRDAVVVDLTEPRLGPVRSTWQYPIGGLARTGAHVSFGSDWPVSSVRPLDGLAIAVARDWLPEHRIALDEAIRAYTQGVAYQVFEEQDVGAIAPGQRADLCLLSAPVASVSPDELPGLDVLGTWRDGIETFRK